ncbi:MAG: class B sortase [Coriobacteriia bacterium]|nr:class B sortase [Coriobacteriia bacterium]
MSIEEETDEATPKGGLLSRLLLIFGSALLVMALAIAGYMIWQYWDAQNRYTQIQSVAGLNVNTQDGVDINTKLEDLRFDWDALRAINPDIVGWILVPGTNINYPIVQGSDNEHYLYHLFDDSYSGTGAIFADYQGSPTLDGINNIIYGHNMLDGSMFSDIYLYNNQDYFNRHSAVYLYTPALNMELTAIALINISENAPLRQFEFSGEDEFNAFVSDIIVSPISVVPNLYATIVEADALYSLVTCETFDFSRRVVLCCIPVRSVVPSA